MRGMAMGGDGGGMGEMSMTPPPRADHAAAPHKMMGSMMHMTFFWGDRAVVLFPGWPGDRGAGMYLLCLLLVLALAALTEALALLSRRLARRGGGEATASSAALLTAAHAARMGTAYLVMLAVMSFNVGVLLAAVAGHALGFLLARSRVRTGAARGGAAGASPELCGIPPSNGSKP
jgi:copper transporter 1